MSFMLLDTGALFAALNQAHTCHAKMTRWLAGATHYSTCGLTQIGAFRLFLLEAAMQGYPLSSNEAHQVVARFTEAARHRFLPCPPIAAKFVGRTEGNRAAFDDYLVQIARDAGTKLVTLDTRLGTRWRDQTEVIH